MADRQPDLWRSIDVRDKPAFVAAAVQALAGDAQISFEGRLDHLHFDAAPVQPAAGLLHPQCPGQGFGFLVLQLSEKTAEPILRGLQAAREHFGRGSGIFHVQIAKDGRKILEGHDRFHPAFSVVSTAFPEEVLEDLVQRGVLRGYGPPNR